MKFLGIDYGTKRVGIAISDEEGKIAFPNDTLANDKKLVEKIISLCKEKAVGAIVIGESNNFSGEPNPIMADVKKFIAELEKETRQTFEGQKLSGQAKLPVILEPEFLTTAQAKRIQGEVEGIDASAASIILQSFLDRKKNEGGNHPSIPSLERRGGSAEKIPYGDFAKVEMRVGKILTAEKIPDTDKLLKLTVDFGEAKPRQIVSGIALYYPDPLKLVGKNCLFVTNLEPRIIRGEESNGMILALSTSEGAFSLLEPDKTIPIGTKVK